ncbi:MAG TPA: OPT family oligopeptide transporter [Kofleriaceae bacterium]|nr:OPT family oligopeptide transporter [Kofleriaceae bacterium]
MSKEAAPGDPHAVAIAAYENYDLPVDGFQGTPEEVERQWFERCYRGRGDSIAQLTVRAVVMGSALGALLSLTNLYIGLKAGWSFGVAITACIMSFAIWTALKGIGLVRTQMTILENNCMQSTASSAGYSTGTFLVSAIPAYIMINNSTLPMPVLMGWVFFIALLGVTMAIPMKRQMINIEQLRFPSGIAAAETLRALHAVGEKGRRAARALSIWALLAAVSQFWSEGLHIISKSWERFQLSALVAKANEFVLGPAWMGRTVMAVWDPIFIAAGMIVGMRTALSMLLGAVTCWIVFIPLVQAHVPEAHGLAGYRDLVQWSLWGGVACMVTSSLLSVALQWRSALRAFSGITAMFSRAGSAKKADDPVGAIETPTSWFFAGQVVGLIGISWLAHYTFGMPYWQSFIAVAMTFAIALVACRVTGETDTTPVGPMGKIMQLTFGGLAPGNMTVNLMAASVTAGAAASSADLLTDLKSGYLLGANPRKQFIAQFCGIFVGTAIAVFAFNLLVTGASSVGNDQFPAPAAQAWKGVAEAMAKGLSELHPVKVWSIAIGGLIGLILPLLARWFPRHARYIPSAAGLGLAWTFHFFTSLSFMIGAVVAWAWQRQRPAQSEEYLFPVASGVIAGGALMGVLLIFIENGPDMVRQLFGG